MSAPVGGQEKGQAGGRRTVALAGVSALARVPGFLIPVLVAARFGAGSHTDAYFVAYGAALLVAGTLAQSIEVAIVPFAARAILEHPSTSQRFFDRTGGRYTLVAGLVWLAVVPIVTLATRAPLRPDVVLYAACFTPLVLLWCNSSVYAGGHVSQGRIATATGSTLWRGAGGLAGVAIMPAGAGLWAVGLGLGAGELCRVLWLRYKIPAPAPAPGGRPRAAGTLATTGSLGHAVAAVLIGAAMGTAAPVLEKLMAVSVGEGAASHLEYAYRILAIPAVLFDGALAPILLARWSHQIVALGRHPTLAEILSPVGKGMAIATALGLTTAVFASTIVHLLLLHGRFTGADAATVSLLVRGLALGFIGTMGAMLLERFYIAATRSRTIATYGSLRAASRVLVALALLRSLGVLAFVVGYATAEWGYFIALAISVKPSLPGPEDPVVREAEVA